MKSCIYAFHNLLLLPWKDSTFAFFFYYRKSKRLWKCDFFLWTCLSRGQINCVTKTNSQEHFSSHKILKKANMLLCLTCVHHMMWMCTKVLFYNNEIFIEKLYTKSCARFIWLSTFYFYFNLFCNGPTFKTSSGYNIFVNTNCIWYKNFI